MRQKLLAVIICSALLLLSGCVSTEEQVLPEQMTNPTETKKLTAAAETTEPENTINLIEATEEGVEDTQHEVKECKPVDVTLREKYTVVLDQYRDALSLDSDAYKELYWNGQELNFYMFEQAEYGLKTEDKERFMKYLNLPNVDTDFPYINQRIVFYRHAYKDEGEDITQNSDICYAYYDLDGNGREELIVVENNGEWGFIVIGLYALGYEDIPVAVSNGVGDRSRLSMYSDGTISINGSSSAFEYTVSYYRLDDSYGAYLDSLCSFTIDSRSSDAEKIEDLCDQFAYGLTPLEVFDWEPLFGG